MRARGNAVSSSSSSRPDAISSHLRRTSKRAARRPSPWIFASVALLFCCFSTTLLWWVIPRPSKSSSHSPPGLTEVTYGSVVKLMHERTKYRLHSHDLPYGSGSQQQSVTTFGGVEDANSYWVVREAKDSSSSQGVTIPDGTVIRLQHMRTRKWLHSHLYQSPLSGNLEVSCFGGEGESDGGDHWILEIEGKDKVWMKDRRVRVHHVDTGAYLHSHDRKYASVAGGQQEVCGVKRKSANSVWIATEGVYLPVGEHRDILSQT